MTTIVEAIKKEDIETLRILLSNIPDTTRLQTHLFLAISLRKPQATQEIFKFCNHTHTNSTDQYGNTPLKTAIYSYHKSKTQKDKENALAVLEFTIQNSDNINIRDSYNNTALATSSFLGLPNVTSLLLKYNADYTITDHLGNNALDKALWEGHKDVVAEFFAHNTSLKDAPILFRGQTPLTKMLYGQKIPMVEFLLAQNVSLTSATEDGTLPMGIAKDLGNQAIIGGDL